MSLRTVLNAAKDAIADLSSLEVQTYTGEITVAIDDIGTTDFETILSNAKATGNISLSQVTKLNIDGDGINLVSDAPPPPHVADAHKAALAAGENVRASILELFKGLINND